MLKSHLLKRGNPIEPTVTRLLKKASSKAAGSEGPEAYSVLYVERFERLRTKLGGFFSSLLIVHFDLEAEVFDHAPDLVGWLAWCCEVAVHKDGDGNGDILPFRKYLATLYRSPAGRQAKSTGCSAFRRLAMWIVWLFCFLLFASPALAEPGFSEKYERDYNIFNPASRYAPNNPLNPAQAYAPDDPFNPVNRKQ